MQEGSVPNYQDRVPLFPGGSCYPLSGDHVSTDTKERQDQLSVIFSVIGMPSEEDLMSVGKVRALLFFCKVFQELNSLTVIFTVVLGQ